MSHVTEEDVYDCPPVSSCDIEAGQVRPGNRYIVIKRRTYRFHSLCCANDSHCACPQVARFLKRVKKECCDLTLRCVTCGLLHGHRLLDPPPPPNTLGFLAFSGALPSMCRCCITGTGRWFQCNGFLGLIAFRQK